MSQYYRSLIQSGISYGALTTAWITANSETDPLFLSKYNTVETAITPFLSKLDAVYGFTNATALRNKLNFINPLDTDAAFRITWSGSVAFTTDGAQGDGGSNAGNTHWVPSINGTLNSFHMSGYARQDIVDNGFFIACAGDNPNYYYIILTPRYTGNLFYGTVNSNTLFNNISNSNAIGFYVVNQKTDGTLQLWKNGVLQSTVVNVLDALNNAPLTLLADGRPSSFDSFSSNRIKFGTIGRELSNAEIISLSTAAATFVS